MNYYLKSGLYFFGRYILKKKYLIGYSGKYDLKFRFRTPDSVGRLIFKKGVYEEELTDYLINNLDLESGDIVFDVGANIGWYSVLLSKCFSGVEVHSFEPDPQNFKILKFNVELNNFKNVISNNIGIGKEKDIVKLYLYKNGNLGRHSMLNINDGLGSTIDVNISSFDEYINNMKLNLSKIKFLKIDIEGYEYFAFLGGKQFLNHVPTILAEFSPSYMRKEGLDPVKLISLLRSYDYRPFIINGMNLEPIDDAFLLSVESNYDLIWKKYNC
jgi:FkbM family methyltransferase